MPIPALAKILIISGLAMAVLGVVLWLGARAGLGNLPGDISWKRGPVSVSFPIVTCIVLSIIGTVVLNVLARLFR